jgi:hypothetical protein
MVIVPQKMILIVPNEKSVQVAFIEAKKDEKVLQLLSCNNINFPSFA